MPISLSPFVTRESSGLRRTAPRPRHLQGHDYERKLDARTVFFDVYRSGEDVVLQGPPLRNFQPALLGHGELAVALAAGKASVIGRGRGSEVWWRGFSARELRLDNALGAETLRVQPDMSELFAGRRVLLTLSKNNELRWILDWITYHHRTHGADAVLLYDNDSSLYSRDELEREVRANIPSITAHVVGWPFPYGPGGGDAAGSAGAPWDSDFCQLGALQHARFRFLRRAKSVLSCDIDELVVDEGHGPGVFADTEPTLLGISYFDGVWIGNEGEQAVDPAERRHASFVHYDSADQDPCPKKWCVVPRRMHRRWNTWSAHDVGGLFPQSVSERPRYRYRHFKAISDNWKYERYVQTPSSAQRAGARDRRLEMALARSGL